MSPQIYPAVKLPHPFLTSYQVQCNADVTPAKFSLTLDKQPANATALPQPLHSDSLTWRDLTSRPVEQCPPGNDNGAWARAYRSPQTKFEWPSQEAPTLGQIWNVVHAIYLAHPTIEYFRLALKGSGQDVIRHELLATGLAIEHPTPYRAVQDTGISDGDILVLRSAFWQGAASPVGSRPIWAVGDGTQGPVRKPVSDYPAMPEHQQFTTKFPEQPIHTLHPTRQPKPAPGSICYSRYIPELNEHFSLEVIDWQNDEHVKLFNVWQNDPRVAKGWNETGTMDEHREYLRTLHFDPHVLCLFGRFDETRFSYYELYWAKVSRSKPLPAYPHILTESRRTTTVRTTRPTTTIAAATHLSATRRSAAPTASMHGIRAVSTIASSTMCAQPMLLASPKRPVVPSCRTRTPSVSLLASTWIWATSARCTRCAAGRSGSSFVRCSGMEGRRFWSRLIARRGMRSCRYTHLISCHEFMFTCINLYDLPKRCRCRHPSG